MKHGERGFTLIEILLAMLVFLAGVSGLYALLSTGLSLQREGVELARIGRRLDEIVLRLEQELSAGRHFDPARGGWQPIASAELPDGTVYAVDFLAETEQPTEGVLLAVVRVAGSVQGLAAAPAVGCVLSPGLLPSAAVAAWRTRPQASLETR